MYPLGQVLAEGHAILSNLESTVQRCKYALYPPPLQSNLQIVSAKRKRALQLATEPLQTRHPAAALAVLVALWR
jgi:hypothetical protein